MWQLPSFCEHPVLTPPCLQHEMDPWSQSSHTQINRIGRIWSSIPKAPLSLSIVPVCCLHFRGGDGKKHPIKVQSA